MPKRTDGTDDRDEIVDDPHPPSATDAAADEALPTDDSTDDPEVESALDDPDPTTEDVEPATVKVAKVKGDGLGHRLYTGEAGFKFIEHRRRWYVVSAVLVLASIGILVFRGLNFGIDFVGGNTFEVPGPAGGLTSAEQVVDTGLAEFNTTQENADDRAEIATSQVAGTGNGTSLLIKTSSVDQATATKIADVLAVEFRSTIEQRLTAAGTPVTDDSVRAQVSSQSIAATWGGNVSQKAVTALLVFLVVVSIFLRLRYVARNVVGALVSLVHDLVIAAGVYAAIGFEVTPATVIGLLTILGFSLYDTVVVFDKIDENVKGITAGSRWTYGEATDLAINQTLMRSINTTVISLLPVGGLLFVGAGLLGAGTLKDLALVLFVGIAVGAYSSIFLAAPITVDLAERRPEYIDLARRVAARRSAGKVEVQESWRRSPSTSKTATAVLDKPRPAPARPKAMTTRSTARTSTASTATTATKATKATKRPAATPAAEPTSDRPAASPTPGTKPKAGSRPTQQRPRKRR